MENTPINVQSFDTDSLRQIISICKAELAKRMIEWQQQTNRIDNEKRDKLTPEEKERVKSIYLW